MSSITLPRTALYFPNIEFADEGWLRRMLCIWDRVARIVPKGYKPNDSDDVKKLLDAGLIESVPMSAADLESTAKDFSLFLKDNPCNPAALDHGDRGMARLHRGKVGEWIKQAIEAHSVTSETDDSDEDDEWLVVPADIANAYMMYLATNAARRRQYAKVTDDDRAFAVSPFFDCDGHISPDFYSPDDRHAHAVLGLTTIVPRHAEHFDIGHLLDFRDKTVDGRRALASQIDQCAADIAKIEDPKVFRLRIDDACADFARSREVIAKQSTYTAAELGNAAMCVGLSTFLAALSFAPQIGQSPFAIVTLMGGGALALAASMGDAYGKRRQLPVDPVRSYYVSLADESARAFRTGAHGRNNRWEAILEEFVND